MLLDRARDARHPRRSPAWSSSYVAFPHRGEDVPGAPWLGDAMRKAVDALPTLEDEPTDDEPAPSAAPGALIALALIGLRHG